MPLNSKAEIPSFRIPALLWFALVCSSLLRFAKQLKVHYRASKYTLES